MKIQDKLSYDMIGRMAETEIPRLCYLSYLKRKAGQANIQSFADYVNTCYQNKLENEAKGKADMT